MGDVPSVFRHPWLVQGGEGVMRDCEANGMKA